MHANALSISSSPLVDHPNNIQQTVNVYVHWTKSYTSYEMWQHFPVTEIRLHQLILV